MVRISNKLFVKCEIDDDVPYGILPSVYERAGNVFLFFFTKYSVTLPTFAQFPFG